LDAPFIPERIQWYSPEPNNTFNRFYDEAKYTQNEEIQKVREEKPPYPMSFLYSEMKYYRLRAYSSIKVNQNVHLSNNVDAKKYTNASIDVESYTPALISMFDGDHPDSIAKKHFNSQFWSRYAEQYKDPKRSNSTVYYSKDYINIDSAEVVPLIGLIKYSFENNFVYAYNEKEYINRIPIDNLKWLFDEPELKEIKVKEDFFIGETGLESKIIGLEFCFELRSVWVYYPEFAYMLYDQFTEYEGKLINYNGIFERHLANLTYDSIVPLGTYPKRFDSEFMMSLDPFFALNLLDESFLPQNAKLDRFSKCEVKNSKLNTYYENGKTSLEGSLGEGLPDGFFQFYYSSGVKKGSLNYNLGVLDGHQIMYWPNGMVYVEYDVVNGEVSRLSRYYENGDFMESGGFENGVFDGLWKYNIQLSPTFRKAFKDWDEHQGETEKGYSYSIDYRKNYNCRGSRWMESGYCVEY
jgi:hypothetical protein